MTVKFCSTLIGGDPCIQPLGAVGSNLGPSLQFRKSHRSRSSAMTLSICCAISMAISKAMRWYSGKDQLTNMGLKREANNMSRIIGPKMSFILRVYHMSEAENAQDIEHDRQMVQAGVMSEREFWKRSSTRDVARNIRRRDDNGSWPRDNRKRAKSLAQKVMVSFH